jgi:hypothetical protein
MIIALFVVAFRQDERIQHCNRSAIKPLHGSVGGAKKRVLAMARCHQRRLSGCEKANRKRNEMYLTRIITIAQHLGY